MTVMFGSSDVSALNGLSHGSSFYHGSLLHPESEEETSWSGCLTYKNQTVSVNCPQLHLLDAEATPFLSLPHFCGCEHRAEATCQRHSPKYFVACWNFRDCAVWHLHLGVHLCSEVVLDSLFTICSVLSLCCTSREASYSPVDLKPQDHSLRNIKLLSVSPHLPRHWTPSCSTWISAHSSEANVCGGVGARWCTQLSCEGISSELHFYWNICIHMYTSIWNGKHNIGAPKLKLHRKGQGKI